MKHAILTLLCLAFCAAAQAQAPASPSPLKGVTEDLQKRLDSVTAELNKLRKQIETEKVPATKRLGELEDQIIEARKEYEKVLRVRDTRTLEVTNLKASIKGKEDTTTYLSNLLDEYFRNAESRLNVTELQRYGDVIEQKRNAAANGNLSAEEKFQARLDLVQLSVDRITDNVGGVVFDGSAVEGDSGVVANGKFLLLGPLAYFAASDAGGPSGLADLRLGSLDPAILNLPPEAGPESIPGAIAAGEGLLPIDSTRGAAFKVEEVKDTVWEEFLKGGPVMWPIGGIGVLAVLVGLLKWLQLALVKRPSNKKVSTFLTLLQKGEREDADALARGIWGPIGRMMRTAARHYTEPPEVMEESMFEHVLDAKTKLNSWIPFVKIAAAVEPLLGLLGTVTGMINTFKLITVFGTGDAQTFSSGISEALITTEWGLITAIPCLLIAAFLSRKARAALDDMEKLGVRIMNHRKAHEPGAQPAPAAAAPPPSRQAPPPPTQRQAPPPPAPPPPPREGSGGDGGGLEPSLGF